MQANWHNQQAQPQPHGPHPRRCNRRIDAVIARNRLDYQYAAQAQQDAAAGVKHPKNVPVMFPLPVTQRLEAGFDASLLDDSDETLQRLFRGDTSVLDEALTKVGWGTGADLILTYGQQDVCCQ
jgi:hypothetical protein